MLLGALAALVARVPYGWLRALGAPLAWLFGSVLRVRRRHVERSMARAGVPDERAEASAMYRALGTGVLELLWLAGQARRPLAGLVAVDGDSEALIHGALAAGRGAVVVASHTGNWEVAACAMAERLPLSVLVSPVSMRSFDWFMARLRAKYGVNLLAGKGALARARSELREGRVVALLGDQVPPAESHGEWTPFLGERALTSRAAAALSFGTGAPLLVTASRRSADGTHRLEVLSVKWPPADDEGRTWMQRVSRESADELAAFIRSFPSQWLWLHRRWRTPIVGRGGRRDLSRVALAGTEGPWKIPSSSRDARSAAG